jgi:hypothetical protein
MLKKILGKAVAGTAAAGLVLVPTAATVSPQVTNVACQYPDSVATTTDVVLASTVAPYGSRNSVTVNVDAGDATARGTVRIRVAGVGSWTKRVTDGSVTQRLPRTLDANETYRVSAQFKGACRFRNSGDVAFYTVNKAAVNVNPTVLNARAARFAATFRGSGGLDPQGGNARFIVQRLNGKVVRAGSDGVERGYARVNLPNLGKGKYRLVVRFSGTPNFERSSDSLRFRVGRLR